MAKNYMCIWPFVWAGIGSRETPKTILGIMNRIGLELCLNRNSILRSGGADGADTAFAKGYESKPNSFHLYRAQDANPASILLAAKYHPNWGACSEYAKKLHARNGLIVLGPELNDPVDLIICWTPKGQIVGGTGQALRIANDPKYKIPVWNLGNLEGIKALEKNGLINSDDVELLMWVNDCKEET